MNLAAQCTRYLLVQNLTHGMTALAHSNADFRPRREAGAYTRPFLSST